MIRIIEHVPRKDLAIDKIKSDHVIWERHYPNGEVAMFLCEIDASVLESLPNPPKFYWGSPVRREVYSDVLLRNPLDNITERG